jgi:predicted O-methyltransferase YrrM
VRRNKEMNTRAFLEQIVVSARSKIEDEKLEEIISRQEDASIRSPGVEAHYYRFFYRLCQALKPNLVLELGTHTGISAMCFALGDPDGKVITVNHSVELMEECRCRNIEYLHQDSLDPIPGISNIDILFIDTDHDGKRCLEEFKLFSPSLCKNGLIFFDDIYLLDCMRKFWEGFEPVGYQKFELPIHGGAGMGVLIKEDSES